MKTPIDQNIIDSNKLSLFNCNEYENYQLNIIKLALKSCIFTCEQVCFLISEIKSREFKVAMITLFYPNIIDRENFEIINNSFDSQVEKKLLDELIKKNYDEDKKEKSSPYSPNIRIKEVRFSELKTNPNFYIEQLKTEKNLTLNTQNKETLDSNTNLKTDSKNIFLNILDSDTSYQNILISNDRLQKYIKSNNFSQVDNLKSKLSQLRSFLNNNYISVNQCLKIISSFGSDDESFKEFILAVYPCIYDPQNIECLVRKIEALEIQDLIRVKLIGMPNFNFEIFDNDAGHSNCCCIIF